MSGAVEPPEGADAREALVLADAPRRQRVAVYGIATDDAGRILLVRAAAYLTVAGRWFLPGGGVEHGETPADALGREVEEETGLHVEEATLLGVLSDTWPVPDGSVVHTVRLVYRIARWSGTLRPEAAGTSDEARWIGAVDLPLVPLVRYVREALTRWEPGLLADGAASTGTPSGR